MQNYRLNTHTVFCTGVEFAFNKKKKKSLNKQKKKK